TVEAISTRVQPDPGLGPPASQSASAPSADQSRSRPPPASKVRKRSRIKLATGNGTSSCSPAASYQAHILEAEVGREAGRLELLAGQQPAVSLVRRRGEQRRRQQFQVRLPVDA